MGYALRIEDLHKSFKTDLLRRRIEILKGVSLTVTEGEIFGYLGPNGAGKTTTMKCLLGLIFPDRGRIEMRGRSHLNPDARDRIGFLPENPYFYDYLTAREFLRFYAQLHGLKKSGVETKISGLIRLVNLERSADLQLRKYSKGMLQRIGLAQALLNDPELVLMDEPLGGLDPLGRKEIRDIIVRLREEGKTVFLSSHILQDIEMVCDRVAVIADGRVISQGSLHELISRKTFFTEVTVSGLDRRELEAYGRCLTNPGGEIMVQIEGPERVDRLLERIKSSEARLHSLVPRTENLEEHFVGMIQAK